MRQFISRILMAGFCVFFIAAARAEAPLDPNRIELHPLVEIRVPLASSEDNRLALLTNDEGALVGMGFDGSWGSPRGAGGAGLRASLAEIRGGKTLVIGRDATPFMKLDGRYVDETGGIVTIASPDGTHQGVIRIARDRGMWRADRVEWNGTDFADRGAVNLVTIDANWRRRITGIRLSYDASVVTYWENMQKRGYYPRLRTRPEEAAVAPSAPSPARNDLEN